MRQKRADTALKLNHGREVHSLVSSSIETSKSNHVISEQITSGLRAYEEAVQGAERPPTEADIVLWTTTGRFKPQSQTSLGSWGRLL